VSRIVLLSLCFCFFRSDVVFGAELLTNAAHFENAQKWLNMTRVNKVVDPIQSVLEWDIRRVEVVWFSDQAAFEKAHGMGPLPLAVSQKSENKILLGPKVVDDNFNRIFGHELVHMIAYQKYKEAIPKWLEEGLANHLAKFGKVDYAWLNKQPFPSDVRSELVHPFAGSEDSVRYRYMASQAMAEMLAAKCDFRNLLRLSVGVGMEGYLDTYCGMKDLNAVFRSWVTSHKH
jgi:hypothetical protein